MSNSANCCPDLHDRCCRCDGRLNDDHVNDKPTAVGTLKEQVFAVNHERPESYDSRYTYAPFGSVGIPLTGTTNTLLDGIPKSIAGILTTWICALIEEESLISLHLKISPSVTTIHRLILLKRRCALIEEESQFLASLKLTEPNRDFQVDPPKAQDKRRGTVVPRLLLLREIQTWRVLDKSHTR